MSYVFNDAIGLRVELPQPTDLFFVRFFVREGGIFHLDDHVEFSPDVLRRWAQEQFGHLRSSRMWFRREGNGNDIVEAFAYAAVDADGNQITTKSLYNPETNLSVPHAERGLRTSLGEAVSQLTAHRDYLVIADPVNSGNQVTISSMPVRGPLGGEGDSHYRTFGIVNLAEYTAVMQNGMLQNLRIHRAIGDAGDYANLLVSPGDSVELETLIGGHREGPRHLFPKDVGPALYRLIDEPVVRLVPQLASPV